MNSAKKMMSIDCAPKVKKRYTFFLVKFLCLFLEVILKNKNECFFFFLVAEREGRETKSQWCLWCYNSIREFPEHKGCPCSMQEKALGCKTHITGMKHASASQREARHLPICAYQLPLRSWKLGEGLWKIYSLHNSEYPTWWSGGVTWLTDVCYRSILPKSDIYNVCSGRILPKSDIYSAKAMPKSLASDRNVIAKITKRFKENIVDNVSVGTLHIPNPMLHSVLACTAQWVTTSRSDMTYTEVNM